MTDKEIIKALECCANATHKDCKNCPLFVFDGCVKTMSTNALDLINRQQVEIERLKNQVNRLKKYDEKGVTTMQNDLKPCPFCGKIPNVHHNKVLGMYQVECDNKDCNVVCHTCFAVKKEYAIENWNRRVDNAE